LGGGVPIAQLCEKTVEMLGGSWIANLVEVTPHGLGTVLVPGGLAVAEFLGAEVGGLRTRSRSLWCTGEGRAVGGLSPV
jgi:hypothetical protein